MPLKKTRINRLFISNTLSPFCRDEDTNLSNNHFSHSVVLPSFFLVFMFISRKGEGNAFDHHSSHSEVLPWPKEFPKIGIPSSPGMSAVSRFICLIINHRIIFGIVQCSNLYVIHLSNRKRQFKIIKRMRRARR